MGYYHVPHSLLSIASILEFPHVWNVTFMKYYEYSHLYQSALPGINWRCASCCYAHYVTQFWRHHRVPWPDGLFLTTGASVCPWHRASRDPRDRHCIRHWYIYNIYMYIYKQLMNSMSQSKGEMQLHCKRTVDKFISHQALKYQTSKYHRMNTQKCSTSRPSVRWQWDNKVKLRKAQRSIIHILEEMT